jgi:hypothetical protein
MRICNFSVLVNGRYVVCGGEIKDAVTKECGRVILDEVCTKCGRTFSLCSVMVKDSGQTTFPEISENSFKFVNSSRQLSLF